MSIDLRAVLGKTLKPAAAGTASSPRPDPRNDVNGQAPQVDSLALTAAAARIKQAGETMATDSVIDTRLVARVTDALQGGTYKIDAEQIAEKIIEMDRQLPEMDNDE